MTAQVLFDTVADHLIAQGRKSMRVNDGGRRLCAYRGDDGCKCAIGVLIPDADYTEAMEGSSIYDPRVAAVVRIPNSLLLLANRLQGIHDHDAVEAWPRSLEGTAQHFELVWRPR